MSKLILILIFVSASWYQPDIYIKSRKKMINEQIVARGITNPAIIKAFEDVPRHLFVPDDMVLYAYDDRPLSIGYGQTISQPYIVAFMTDIVNLQKTDTVLEIGTGSGYQAAILAKLTSRVYTIEIVKPLGIEATERLKKLGYSNVEVKIGDGYIGWKEHAPYDAIIVTAAATSIPQPLIDQLKDGGKMIIPVGSQNYNQELVLVQKKGNKINKREVLPVRFVPFTRH